MSLFVDTSVWPLALRRDNTERGPEVAAFTRTPERCEPLYITGLVLQ